MHFRLLWYFRTYLGQYHPLTKKCLGQRSETQQRNESIAGLGFRVKPEKVTDESPLKSLELDVSKPFLNPLTSIEKTKENQTLQPASASSSLVDP